MDSLTIVLDKKLGSFTEFATFALAAVVLDLVELFDGAEEAGGVEAEPGDLLDGFLRRERRVSEDGIVESWDAIEAPGGVGELLAHGGFSGGGGLVFFEEPGAELLVGSFFFRGEDEGLGEEAMG